MTCMNDHVLSNKQFQYGMRVMCIPNVHIYFGKVCTFILHYLRSMDVKPN